MTKVLQNFVKDAVDAVKWVMYITNCKNRASNE